MKKLEEIKFSDFTLVELINNKPSCKKHGAMNKMNTLEDGSGYWRCITVVNSKGSTVCRAGCKY